MQSFSHSAGDVDGALMAINVRTGGPEHDDPPASSFGVDRPLGPVTAGLQLWAAADIQPPSPNGGSQSLADLRLETLTGSSWPGP